MKRRLAVVVQRYGADVTGGSESLARAVAERLAGEFQVTVFTTCARDYVTWANELPEGREEHNGVEVLRFPSTRPRDLASFNTFSDELYDRPHTDADEILWLERQGPFVPGLVERLAAEKDRFAAVLFFTYLYYPAYWGLQAAPDRAILVPTAHDEPALRLRVFERVFAQPRAFAFCSGPEEALVRSRFDLGGRPSAVTGIGVDEPRLGDVEGFRIRNEIHTPYALYAGRIDAGKGCDEMIEHHARYRRTFRGAAELLLIGKLAMPEPRSPGIRYLGFLSEEDKAAAVGGARALVCPSPFESLSIVLLEAFRLGTPGLVSERSPVLKDHVLRSQAGLFYGNGDEYGEAMDLLASSVSLRQALGANGRRYVDAQYGWEQVIARYRALIDEVAAGAPPGPA